MGSLLFDQMLFSPIFYCGYFITDAIVSSKSIPKEYKKGEKTLIADLAVWRLATGVNLYFIPLQYQVLFLLFICLFWDIVLC
jgi:hypothetical protein